MPRPREARGARRLRSLLASLLLAAACGDGAGEAPRADAPVPLVPDAPPPPEPDAGTPCPLVRVGGLDSLSGTAFGVGPDRFVIVNGTAATHLTLAARRGDGLAALATLRVPGFIIDATQLLGDRAGDDLLVLGERGERDLSLISLEAGDALRARGALQLPGQLVSLAARGDRLWTCTRAAFTGFQLSLFDLADPDAPLDVGALPLAADCGSIAFADDGARLFVNTREGVRSVDLSGAEPALSEVFAPTAGVSAGEGRLLLRGATALRVLGQRDLVEIATIPASGVLAAASAGGRLLLEGFRTAGGGMEGYVALWALPDGAPPQQLDEVVVWTTRFVGDPPPAWRSALTSDGSAMITHVAPRLFDLAGDRLLERRVPALLPLDQLSPSENAGVARALGSAGSAQLDLADPRAPAFAGGGAFGVPSSFDVAVDESEAARRLLFVVRSNDPAQASVGSSWEPDPLPVRRWRLDAAGAPDERGTFRIAGHGAAQLFVAGELLVRLRLPAGGLDATLQGWSLPQVGSAGEIAPAAFDVVPAPGRGGSFAAADVDPVAHRAVVATGTASGGVLTWLDLGASPPAVLERVELPAGAVPRHLRVAGARAVGTGGLELRFWELGRGEIGTVSSGKAYIDHLLRFDGREVIHAQSLPFGIGVTAFGAGGTLAPPLPLDGVATSVVPTATGYAVGLPWELVTVEPRCQ